MSLSGNNFLLVYKAKQPNHFASKIVMYGEDFVYKSTGIQLLGPANNIHHVFIEPDTQVKLEEFELLPCVFKAGKYLFEFYGVALSWGNGPLKLGEVKFLDPTKPNRWWVEVKLFNDTLNAIEFSEGKRLELEKKKERSFKKFVKHLPW